MKIFNKQFGILKGLLTTLKHLFQKPFTVSYPEQKLHISDNYRGRHIFYKDKCIGCYLCQMKCPDGKNVISIETEKDKITNRNKIVEYTINLGTCCFCGICAEVCPTKAITMSTEYEMVAYDKKDLILDSQKLSQIKKEE